MSSGRQHAGSAPYRPTSLDFINLPNPIEPHAQSQKHPLNDPPRHEKAQLEAPSNQALFNILREKNVTTSSGPNGRPSKRQKGAEHASLDLPRLPIRNAAKRMRIPPTLSGLHHPPPDAGLLPSINVEQPQIVPARLQDLDRESESQQKPPPVENSSDGIVATNRLSNTSANHPNASSKKSKRNKWTDVETESLLKGVARFGIGNWTKVLNCSDYQFNKRTAIDLKDRFRVCCPDQYKSSNSTKVSQTGQVADPSDGIGETNHSRTSHTKVHAKGPVPERVSSSKLKNLGITEPFAKTTRRSRHGYSSEEDEAILRGFRKYGNSWASIQQDSSLGLSTRKSTDLRDRFRTRYPEEYAKTGLAMRKVEKTLTASNRTAERSAPHLNTDAGSAEADSGQPLHVVDSPFTSTQDNATKNDASLSTVAGQRKPPQPTTLAFEEFFDNLPFDPANEYDNEPVVLDRGILDWATTDAAKAPPLDFAKINGIDPLMTLKLPEPVSSKVSFNSTSHQTLVSSATTSLPSLATLIPVSNSSQEQFEQLELPSLLQLSGLADTDGRTGGTNLTLDELMS